MGIEYHFFLPKLTHSTRKYAVITEKQGVHGIANTILRQKNTCYFIHKEGNYIDGVE